MYQEYTRVSGEYQGSGEFQGVRSIPEFHRTSCIAKFQPVFLVREIYSLKIICGCDEACNYNRNDRSLLAQEQVQLSSLLGDILTTGRGKVTDSWTGIDTYSNSWTGIDT